MSCSFMYKCFLGKNVQSTQEKQQQQKRLFLCHLLISELRLCLVFCFYLVNPPHRTLPAPPPRQLNLSTSHCPGCPPPAAATICRSAGAQATWRVPSRPSTSASLQMRARLRHWPLPTSTASRVSRDSFSLDRMYVLKSYIEGVVTQKLGKRT